MTDDLFETVLVPIANPDDAEATARAVHRYASPESTIIVTHVVEKGEGVPDKVSVRQREQYAEEAYETFIELFPDEFASLRFVTLYGRDIAETLLEGADEAGATLIAFTPRGGSRWRRFITGDVARKLIDNSDIPIIALPEQPRSIEM